MLMASRTAARDRASGPARDQREEAGAFGERRVAQVSYTEMTSRARGAIDADYTRSQESREPARCTRLAVGVPRVIRAITLWWCHRKWFRDWYTLFVWTPSLSVCPPVVAYFG